MADEFHLPDIGEGLTEATVVSWLVELGDEVSLDEPLVEMETDKAIVEIPSPFAGVLLYREGGPGDVITVGRLLAVVGDAGETWVPAPPAADAAPIVGRLEEADELPAAGSGSSPGVLPRVRKMAADLGVDLAAVKGTGPNGRPTEEDVRGAATETGPSRRVSLSATRRSIVRNLTRSWQEIPHVTTYGEANAVPILEARRTLGGVPLEAMVIERIVPLLEQHPRFNASFDGDAVIEHLRYDIGFAVDSPEGLLVAVIRDAGNKTIDDLATEVLSLSAAARDRTATAEQLRGQTFTISNIGAVGGGYGTPIVPHGTTAILSLGRAEPRPVVRDAEIVIGTDLPLSLSYDHRVIDGAGGRAFLADVITAIES